MKHPEEVKLSQEEGEALIERVQVNRLTESDQRVLVKLIRLYFWLTFALRETKISLGRLKSALFGNDLVKDFSTIELSGLLDFQQLFFKRIRTDILQVRM